MSYNRQDVIFKVKKLYELSTSSNENEAALAAAKARELLAKYNLSMADLPADRIHSAVEIIEQAVDTGRVLRNWVKALIVHICQGFSCQHVIRRHRRSPPSLAFIGTPADARIAAYTFEFLYRALNRLADENTPRLKSVDPGRHSTALRYAYLEGAVKRIGERILEETAAARAEEEEICTALVVAKEHLVDEYMRRTFHNLRRESSRCRVVSAGAFAQGYCDAETISLRPGLEEDDESQYYLPLFG